MSELPDRRPAWIDNLTRHWSQEDVLAQNRPERRSLLPILQHMTTRIRSHSTMDEILTSLAASACEALDCDIALIRVFDSEHMTLTLLGSHGVPQHLLGDLANAQTNASEQFAELRPGALISYTPYRPLVLQNSSEVISAEFQEMQNVGGLHILVLPLFHHGHLLGRLDLLRTHDERFDVEDGALANILGTLIAGAIYGVNQDDSGERYNRIIDDSFAFQQSIEPLANVGEMFQNVVEATRNIVGCDRCYGLLWAESRREFSPVAVSGAERSLVDRLKTLSFAPKTIPALDQILRDDEPLVIADAGKDRRLPAAVTTALNLNSTLIVPLRGRQRALIGVIMLDRSGPESQFSERDLSLVGIIGPHSAMMIENALLYEEVKRASDRLALVNDIGIELATLTNINSLFHQVQLHVASVLTADRFCIGLLLPDGASIEYHYAIDDVIAEQPVTLKLHNGPLARAMHDQKPILINKRESRDKRDWFPPEGGIDPSQSMLAAPIIVGNRAIGVISTQSNAHSAYTKHDLDLLATVGAQTGVAIENARIYSLAQERGERRAYLLDQMITRQEAERKTIADDIHNDTLQTLASCLYSIDFISRRANQLSPEETQQELCTVRDNLAQNIDRLRHIIFQIRPSTLDILGLEPALREHAKYVQREATIDISLAVSLPERLSNDMETAVYRIVQETIHLVRARPNVTHIVVRIRQKGPSIIVTVADDGQDQGGDDSIGRASDRQAITESEFSLIALRERVELAGGQVKTASLPTGGSTLQIILPNRSAT
ncbi:MAG TPA: GAF domain-containing protein [Nitrolancea sp.]|nr:GAF domain-containing protein [Nitrolancea sp.]